LFRAGWTEKTKPQNITKPVPEHLKDVKLKVVLL
jgi:hypothetical protein